MHPFIIEPRELGLLQSHPDVRVIDLCRDENYHHGHIAGAIHVTPAELISGVRPAVGALPSIDRLAALFSRIGYSPDLHFVAYDDEGGGWAGRFLWTLDMIGHQEKSYLNGGLIAWTGEDFAVTPEVVTPTPTRVELTIDPTWRATMGQVLESLNDDNTVVWDARSADEYSGARRASARGGHIPGAINFDWQHVMDPHNHLKIRADIAAALASQGITPDKQVITHCQTHHRSGLTYWVGRSLGYSIRAYDGSWSEWGNDPSTPIDT